MGNVYIIIVRNKENNLVFSSITEDTESCKKVYTNCWDSYGDAENKILVYSMEKAFFYENLCSGYKLTGICNGLTPTNILTL